MTTNKFPSQRSITLRARTSRIVIDDRLAVTGRFAESNRPRDNRVEDLGAEMASDARDHLLAQIGSRVIHREDNSFQRQRGVSADLLDPLDHLQNFSETFQGQIFALQRHQDRIGGGQRIGHQNAERRWAIDDHIFHHGLARPVILQHTAQTNQPVFIRGELNFAPGKIELGRHDVEMLEARRLDLLRQRTCASLFDENRIKTSALDRGKSDRAAGIGLGIEIDQ